MPLRSRTRATQWNFHCLLFGDGDWAFIFNKDNLTDKQHNSWRYPCRNDETNFSARDINLSCHLSSYPSGRQFLSKHSVEGDGDELLPFACQGTPCFRLRILYLKTVLRSVCCLFFMLSYTPTQGYVNLSSYKIKSILINSSHFRVVILNRKAATKKETKNLPFLATGTDWLWPI